MISVPSPWVASLRARSLTSGFFTFFSAFSLAFHCMVPRSLGLHLFWSPRLTLFLSLSLSVCISRQPQASLQNVQQRPTHWLQLFVLHQDGTLQPGLPDGQREPPQPRRLFRRQWELQFNHEWPSERTWLATSLPFCSYPRRQWACQETVWWLLQHHRGRPPDQVRIHAQLDAQETVFSVWRHRVWVPLWGSILWSLQGVLQEDDSRWVTDPLLQHHGMVGWWIGFPPSYPC